MKAPPHPTESQSRRESTRQGAPTGPLRGRRVVRAVVGLGLIAAIALGLAWGERQGWPWLVQPVADVVSRLIGRQVDVQGERLARLHLWGGVRLSAPQLKVGGPDWAGSPWLLSLEDGELGLGYGAIWRMSRGGAIEIERLRARRLQAWLTRRADGRASWQMGAPHHQAEPPSASNEAPWQQIRVHDMALQQGLFHLDDAVLGVSARAAASVIPLQEGDRPARADAAWQWALRAEGRHRGQPLSLQAHSGRPWRWSGDRELVVEGRLGRASLGYRGRAPDASGAIRGQYSLSGPSLAAVGEAVGVTLPTTASFRMRGSVASQGEVTHVTVTHARIGRSSLSGEFTHTRASQPPTLIGVLRGSRLALADLGPAVGVTPSAQEAAGPGPARKRVLPDRPFNLPSLQAMDADVRVAIEVFDPGVSALQAMRDLRGRIVLKAGVLRVEQLSMQLAQGRVQGLLELDGRATRQAVLRADLDIDDVDLARWVRPLQRPGQAPYLSGVLQGHLDVTGRGRSTAELLGTLDGRADFTLKDGQVSHLGVELAGLDLMESVFQWARGDENLPITCMQWRFDVKAGEVRPAPMIVSTADSTLWVDGQLSLKDETLDLRTRVAPKDFSLVALRTPVQLKGPWQDVEVKVFEATTWARVLGAAALVTVHPLAGLVPLIDGGQHEAAREADLRCRQAQAGASR